MRAAPRSDLNSKPDHRAKGEPAVVRALDTLPPLLSLRVFEACARLRSTTDAASELSMSPAAVTAHIRAVEKWAGGALFVRRGDRVALTGRAEKALRDLQHAFSFIAAGAEHLKQPCEARLSVAVSVEPVLASHWLLPRLERFKAAHPDIEIWLSAGAALVDFSNSDVDFAIRCGPGDYPGLVAKPLAPGDAQCAPKPARAKPGWRYWLVWPSAAPLSPAAKVFAAWLAAEFNASDL